EDGIRDRNVTGVQTCALPIYRLAHDRLACSLLAHNRLACSLLAHNRLAQASPGMFYVGDGLQLPTLIATGDTYDCHVHDVLNPKIGRASCRDRDIVQRDGEAE